MNADSTSFAIGRQAPTKTGSGWWILSLLLFSMLTEGFVIPVLGRTPNLSLFDILLPMVVLYLLAMNFIGDHYSGFPDRTVLFLALAYLLAHLTSLLVNYSDVLRSIVAIKVFTFGFLSYWIIINVTRSRLSLERATESLILWGAVIGTMLLYRFVVDWSFLIDPQAGSEVKDQISILGWARSNYLASLLVPILPVAAGGVLGRRGIQRLMMILAAGLIAFGLLITMSKGAILSLIIGSLCALPVFRKAGLRLRHLFVLLGLAIIFLMFVPTDLVATNYDMILYRADNPDFNRLDLWRIAWQEFLRSPILGIGPNCIYIYNRQYAIDVLYSHNFVLNVLADLGLVGALPFFALLGILIRRSYIPCLCTSIDPRFRWISIGLFVGLISTLIHGLVEPTFPGREYSVVFWACAALTFLYDPSHTTVSSNEIGGQIVKRAESLPSF